MLSVGVDIVAPLGYYITVNSNRNKPKGKGENMNNQYYINMETGETTENHNEAVEWYRNGATIGIWKNGKIRCTWVH